MPFYAYPNEQRNVNDVVYAENVTNENKLNEYYCPTRGCDGRMYVRGLESAETKTHFAIKPSYPHSDFCRIGKESYNPTEYEEDLFDYNTFMQNLLEPQPENDRTDGGSQRHGNGDGNIKPISTVRQLYLQCINMDIYQTYNGIRICDILVDSRTNHIYKYYIRGYRLVECYCYRFDPNNNTYYAKYWLNDEHTQYLMLELKCANEKLYERQRERRIFRNNIIVAGLWENSERNVPSITINRSKQIYKLL